MLDEKIIKEIERQVKKLPNVQGYSKTLKKKIVNGEETSIMAIRIYVDKKIKPKSELKPADIIPEVIQNIPTDVVPIGTLCAPPKGPLKTEKKTIDKTQKFRPVILGVSIGNHSITAGTNGILYKDGKGNVLFGSNAHVFCEFPERTPEEQTEKRELQPGAYDIQGAGGNVDDPDYVVAEYVWHRQIHPSFSPSQCPIADVWALIYNAFAEAFKAKTRLKPVTEEVNQIDFAVAKPLVDYELKFPDFDFTDYKLVGHGFAGSDATSIICKIKLIQKQGYTPLNVETAEAKVGDTLDKIGRTSCHTSAKVIDESAVVQVSYGTFTATFDDVILVEGEFLKPGDSGSSVWLKT
jgi:hypothetical protein